MVCGGYQSLRNILQIFSFELSLIICEDSSGYIEHVYDTLQEFDRCFLRDVYHWHSFYPLGECINHDE
jgi:hypothetical protein